MDWVYMQLYMNFNLPENTKATEMLSISFHKTKNILISLKKKQAV